MNKETGAVNGQQGSLRLLQVLALLGYRPAQPRHHRSNLLSALRDFAALGGDTETENACEALLTQQRSESDEPGTQTQKVIIQDEFWQAAALFPTKKPDAFLRTPSPSFSTVYPGLLESALQTLFEDAANGIISKKQSESALAYAVALMENGDHDTLAQWLKVARKNAWSCS
ncbi:hypothetical protein WKH00_22865 [Pantoea agglomerans]|uniref:hypothetical protein n=1 Tax=Enterobacter agglomerans TaxID=549 RepID=UPI003C7B619B